MEEHPIVLYTDPLAASGTVPAVPPCPLLARLTGSRSLCVPTLVS